MTISGAARAVIVCRGDRVSSAALTAASWREHHPDVPVVACVVDTRPGRSEDLAPLFAASASIVAPDTIGLGRGGELERLGLALEADALVRHLRPWVMAHVMRTSGGPVVSLPDDATVHGRIDELARVADGEVTVVATRSGPVPRDGRQPDDADLVRRGRVDQVLCSIGSGGDDVLAWWCERVTRDPHAAAGRIDPTQVAWLDHLPTGWSVITVNEPSINVSFLNADESGRSPDAARLLRWIGFDAGRPWLWSGESGAWPRVLLSEHPRLRSAAGARATALAGPTQIGRFDRLPTGHPIDPDMRSAYAEGLRIADGTGSPEPPNPFADLTAHASFLDWLTAPAAPDRSTSRYVTAAWSRRPDLRALHPDPELAAVRDWARDHGRSAGLWGRLLLFGPTAPADTTRTYITHAYDRCTSGLPAEAHPLGINVFGYLSAELGMGEAARLAMRAVAACGEVHVAVDYAATQQHGGLRPDDEPDAPYDVNLVVVNADAFDGFLASRPPTFTAGRATIGLWFWEVERFPDRFARAADALDEIWVASQHVADAIRPAVKIPVHVFPLGASPAQPPSDDAGRLDLARHGIAGDRFVFGFIFDFASAADRKNPWGLVEAYCAAFPEASTGPGAPALVLKTMGSAFHLLDRERLLSVIAGRDDIVVLDGFASTEELRALSNRFDAYVSLHRAEGWGLTIAEHLARGIPVIATAYSGNLEFMDDTVGWTVPYRLVEIAPTTPTYAGCGRWAEPDIAAAALAMREVLLCGPDVPARAARGRKRMAALAASDAGARFVCERVAALRDRRRAYELAASGSSGELHKETEGVMNEALPTPLSAHPGVGPVVIPPPPPTAVGARRGVAGSVADRLAGVIEPELAAQRATELHYVRHLVEQLQLTRLALSSGDDRLRADLDTLTVALGGLTSHVHELQRAHDVLTESHRALQDHHSISEQAQHDREARTADVAQDLARVEARLLDLLSALDSSG